MASGISPDGSTELWPAAVVFDLDGTLAESFPAIARALDRALVEAGFPPRGLAWTRRHVGRGAEVLLRAAAGSDDEAALRALGSRFERHYRAIYLDETPPVKGAASVLAHVADRTRGRVGVVSNKYAELCRGWLDHWDLARYVATVAGPETSGFRKPDPGALRPVIEAFGVAPGDALLVGDMDVDVETGHKAGVPVVAVRGGATTLRALTRAHALAILAALSDLPAWLAENGRGWR